MQPIDVSAIPYNSWYGRALRLPLKLIPRGTALPILQGPLKGERWILSSSVQSCWFGSYEYDKCALFQKRIREGSIVFDIGAQAGYHTLLASRLTGLNGKVYSFEPAPRNLSYLRQHVELLRLENVSVVDAAVSEHTGTAFFDLGPSVVAGHLADHGIPVRCVGIDEEVIAGRLPAPDYLKIDVEGAELDVLHGARKVLSTGHPEIFLDTHCFLGGKSSNIHAECCEFLSGLGYQIESIGPEKVDTANQIHAWRAQPQVTTLT